MDEASETIDWVKVNSQWELSGLSQEKFCESRSLAYSTFVYHRGRILEKKKKLSRSSFSRVQVARPLSESAGCLVLRLPTGIQLDIGTGSDISQLKQILGLLGVPGC